MYATVLCMCASLPGVLCSSAAGSAPHVCLALEPLGNAKLPFVPPCPGPCLQVFFSIFLAAMGAAQAQMFFPGGVRAAAVLQLQGAALWRPRHQVLPSLHHEARARSSSHPPLLLPHSPPDAPRRRGQGQGRHAARLLHHRPPARHRRGQPGGRCAAAVRGRGGAARRDLCLPAAPGCVLGGRACAEKGQARHARRLLRVMPAATLHLMVRTPTPTPPRLAVLQRSRCSATSACGCRPAPRWPWWARAAAASPPSSASSVGVVGRWAVWQDEQ